VGAAAQTVTCKPIEPTIVGHLNKEADHVAGVSAEVRRWKRQRDQEESKLDMSMTTRSLAKGIVKPLDEWGLGALIDVTAN